MLRIGICMVQNHLDQTVALLDKTANTEPNSSIESRRESAIQMWKRFDKNVRSVWEDE